MATPHVVRRSDLVRLGACEAGLKIHDAVSVGQGTTATGDNVYPDGWTPMHSAILWSTDAPFLIWLEKKGLIPVHEFPDRETVNARVLSPTRTGKPRPRQPTR